MKLWTITILNFLDFDLNLGDEKKKSKERRNPNYSREANQPKR